MNTTRRTKKEMIKYFMELSSNFSTLAHREEDPIKSAIWKGKAEAYELAAFEIEHNMK